MKLSVTATCDSQVTVLPVATLGDATKNRNNPICVVPLKDSCKSLSLALLRLNFANVNTA